MNTKPSIFDRLKIKTTISIPSLAPLSPVETWSNLPCLYKYRPLYEWYDRDTMDILLTRDWFISDECILEVLECADRDAWDWIYSNRKKYSTRIRMLIEPDDYHFQTEKLNTRVVELTDSILENIKSTRKKNLDKAFDNDWIEYSKTLQDRKLEDIDSDLDNVWERFSRAKDVLTNYLETSSKKYISSLSHGPTRKQTELEDKIRELENEYLETQRLVDAEDELYWNKQRDAYLKIWTPNV